MNKEAALSYFQTLGQTLREEPNRSFRRNFMATERFTPEFLTAFSFLKAQTGKERWKSEQLFIVVIS